MRLRPQAAFLVLAAALASCSAGTPVMTPAVATASMPAVSSDNLDPHAPCPVSGRTYTRLKASTTVTRGPVARGKSVLLHWTVVFKDQPSSKAPVTYSPRLIACGPPAGKKPVGAVLAQPGGSTRASGHNGKWTITVTYQVRYTAPNKLPGNRNWKYDLIEFGAPKGYGPLPGIILEIFN